MVLQLRSGPAAEAAARAAAPVLSLVIPVYNERDSLAPLLDEIHAALEGSGGRGYEVLFVDDGSTDGSDRVLAGLARADGRVRVVTLRENAGQSAALEAGFRRARGAVVVTLDADLQNDPADIPRLLEALDGCDAVVGARVRRCDGLLRRLSSRVANYVRNRLSDESIADTGCALKAFRREALLRLRLYDGMHRFLPTLMRIEGFRVREIAVGHRPRRHGRSRYRFGHRVVPAFLDLLAVRWMKRRRLRYEVKDDA